VGPSGPGRSRARTSLLAGYPSTVQDYKLQQLAVQRLCGLVTSDTTWVHVDPSASLPVDNAHNRRHDNGWQRGALEYSHRQDAMAAALGLAGKSPTAYQNRW
jgi:hypothetical protein